MERNELDMLVLAALLHDVGKFAERARMELPPGYAQNNAGLYQPFNERQKRHTHRHALYTAAFLEQFSHLLPRLPGIGDVKTGDSFINLAAMHHKPETPLQTIVTVADCLSSGLDRQVFEGDETGTAYRDFRKTRLIPLAEELLRGKGFYQTDSLDSYQYRYRLAELSPEQVFAQPKAATTPTDNDAATAEYAALFGRFTDAVGKLAHRDHPHLWIDHFTSLWERFTSAIPAATVGKVIPDVSLYDHSRATAALAAALLRFHEATDSLKEASIRNNDSEKFVLITGDFFGIQNFIFSEGGSTNRSAAKILRGRSFAVSLLSELAAEELCREIGLPNTSILRNAAGKFTILAPNLPLSAAAVSHVEKKLNDWLAQHFFGETAIGFSMVAASGNDFAKGIFPALWERLAQACEARKCRKIDLAAHAGVVTGYLDKFDNRLTPTLCPFCGKRPADPLTLSKPLLGSNEAACGICYDHIQMGFNLIRAKNLAVVEVGAQFSGNSLIEPLFGRYQISFDLSGPQADQLMKGGKLLSLRHLVRAGEQLNDRLAMRFISGYVPVYTHEDEHDSRLLHGRMSEEKKLELIDMLKTGGAKSFHHIAKGALVPHLNDSSKFSGTEALGFFKADVDNLGKLFACGLPEDRLNISRLATFSRQMNSFFTIYLPHLLATDNRFHNIYTVFAGGDDLFLIGPWNRIIEFATVLRESFGRFACDNREISLSCGVSVHKPGVPVPVVAHQAETALAAAKDGGRNAITLFGETVSWSEYEQLREIRETLEAWQRQGYVGKALLYRLNEFLTLAQREKRLVASKSVIDLRDLDCLAWRAKFTYTATRNVGKTLDKNARRNALDEVMQTASWLQNLDGKLKIALWQVLYNQR
jgi:CRISPR-associated protein Csm1